ncbi:polyketide synthase family protein, partial [Frankia sp. EI5c]|uniref:type I polyketide synthase n=1 Tax=Frankia sp. EI5c TaxID=683316 RepID=UPI0007C25420
HGTGTTLGDPIEAQALLATYGQNRPTDQPLYLGSIKSNIGHTQAAAGTAGIIKMIQAIHHGLLPATLHIDQPSHHVDWTSGHVELLTDPRPWPDVDRPRRAAVSSFGISGTNAHVILEQAPDQPAGQAAESSPAGQPGQPGLPWLLSARSRPALRAQAARLVAALEGSPAEPAAVGHVLATGRATFTHRAAVTATGAGGRLAALRALAADEDAEGLVRGPENGVGTARPRVVLVFPGQGAQWPGMARGLAATSPVFAEHLRAATDALRPYLDVDLFALLTGPAGAPEPGPAAGSDLERVEVVQPALFAVMVALAALWRHLGVEPDAVLGHSQGEIAAAQVAGALSLADAARLSALRARALTGLAGQGGMLSVALPAERTSEHLAPYGDAAHLAAVNSPTSTVVSGTPAALDALAADLSRDGIRTRRVPVDYASHSPQVEAIADELRAAFGGITPQAASVPFHSAVTAGPVDTATLDAAYWYRNIREPVRFHETVRGLLRAGHQVFLEVSPHPVVTVGITETIEAEATATATASGAGTAAVAVAVGTLRRDDGGWSRFLASAAELHTRGVTVDWAAARPATGPRPEPVELPTYPFERRRYWLDRPVTADGDPLDRWRYREVWRPLSPPGARAPAARPVDLAGSWLLVVPTTLAEGPHARFVTAALAAHGGRVHPLPVDLSAGEVDAAWFADRLGTDDADGPRGVVSLLGLAAEQHPGHPAVPAGIAGTLELVRALAAHPVPARLWAVTSGAVRTGQPDDPTPVPEQAQLWGLGRTIALEHPELWAGLIDLPHLAPETPETPETAETAETPSTVAADAAAAAGIAQIFGAPAADDVNDTEDAKNAEGGEGVEGVEDQVALRSAGGFARRLVRAGRRAGDGSWHPRGAVLVTGGTGGIGAHLARWLADNGAEHLILTSRRGAAAPGAAELVAELTARDVTAGSSTPGRKVAVTVVAADTADPASVDVLRAAIDAAGPPLTAVFHAAGLAQEAAPVATMTAADYAEVVAAKTTGAELLAAAVADHPVETLVLFSSNAGVWGSGGQGAYAAGNAHLDLLAHRLRGQGRQALSVAWGAWADGGMLARPEAAEGLQRRGLRLMAPRLALRALAAAIAADETTLSISDMDWSRFAPAFTARRPSPLLSAIDDVRAALGADRPGGAGTTADDADGPGGTGSGGAAGDAQARLRARLAAAPTAADRDALLLDVVRAAVAASLGHADPAQLDADVPFKELGLDSLTAVEVRNRLNAATGLRLPTVLVFDHPTPLAVVERLRTEIALPTGPGRPGTAGGDGDGGGDLAAVPVQRRVDELERVLAALPTDDPNAHAAVDRLQALLWSWTERRDGQRDRPDGHPEPAGALEVTSDDELFAALDRELDEDGVSR